MAEDYHAACYDEVLTEEGREDIKYTKVLDMRNKKGSN